MGKPETIPVDPLIDAAENVIIAYGMGWDMDGVIERLRVALPAGSPCRSATVPPDPGDVGPWYLEHVEGSAGTWFWSPERQAWAEGMYHTTPAEMASLGWRVVPDPRTPPIGRTW